MPGPSSTAVICSRRQCRENHLLALGMNSQLTLVDAATQQIRSAVAVFTANVSPAGPHTGPLAELASLADVVIENKSEERK
ncbi:hypothetical protein [Mycobacterium leprae]|uniref:hypothetical protein n=1 Tax=Mycobacterium leprae TaxID=1769 RepID=UPI0012E87355|nr:hypothetical protein [Mycobacterium leprae]